jgi:hypothetical protein
MKNKFFILIFLILLVLPLLNFVSADGETCCLELNNGDTCEEVLPSECSYGSTPITSCTQVQDCFMGTCVLPSGECTWTNKYVCERDDGTAYPNVPIKNINACQKGCCTYGTNFAELMTGSQCTLFGFDRGWEMGFDPGITTIDECNSQLYLQTEGACVYGLSSGAPMCKRLTGDECNDIPDSYFKEYSLCTDETLPFYCQPSTTENMCGYGDKVYFKDTCGNMANIYDESMFPEGGVYTSQQMREYWAKIKSFSEACEYTGDSSCGNCNILQQGPPGATICKSYNEAKDNKWNEDLTEPLHGNNVCASMNCAEDLDGSGEVEDDEYYLHQEEWCGENYGVIWDIQKKPEINEFLDDEEEQRVRELVKEYNKYNIPGSEYDSYICLNGEVSQTDCKPYREQICMEFTRDSGVRGAACVDNMWEECLDITSQNDCEDSMFCQWIPGYRFDGIQVTKNEGGYHDQDYGWNDGTRQYVQGSCVPLFAPGFQFWGPSDEGTIDEEDLSFYGVTNCMENSTILESVVYETGWWVSRDKFAENPACEIVFSETNTDLDLSGRCSSGCYAIPDYGRVNQFVPEFLSYDEMIKIHTGGQTPGEEIFELFCISDRRNYYCTNDGAFNEIIGSKADCAAGDNHNRVNFPIFFTNELWLTSITERTKYMGDCGYKDGIFSNLEDLDSSLEQIWSGFTKLDNEGNPEDDLIFEKIFEGRKYIDPSYLGEGISSEEWDWGSVI